MNKLSKFDLAMIIAFVVIGVIGFGAYWYLSGQLQDAQGDVTAAKTDYDKYAVNQNIVVSTASQNALQSSIDLIKTQLDPLVESKLQPKENKLFSIAQKDPVTWKHDLDDAVTALASSAKLRGVKIPQNYYFSFSRYLNQSPDDQQTSVLSKQLVVVEQIANILINAQVKNIVAIRRTYEEDGRANGANSRTGGGGGVTGSGEGDRLTGSSVDAGDGVYTAYPFEMEFDTDPESLRKVVDGLIQSPYIFLIRSITVQNSQDKSPLIDDLASIVGSPQSVDASNPGDVANTPAQPPQFLFGDATLHVKILVDLVQWNGVTAQAPADQNNRASRGRTSAPGTN